MTKQCLVEQDAVSSIRWPIVGKWFGLVLVITLIPIIVAAQVLGDLFKNGIAGNAPITIVAVLFSLLVLFLGMKVLKPWAQTMRQLEKGRWVLITFVGWVVFISFLSIIVLATNDLGFDYYWPDFNALLLLLFSAMLLIAILSILFARKFGKVGCLSGVSILLVMGFFAFLSGLWFVSPNDFEPHPDGPAPITQNHDTLFPLPASQLKLGR